MIAGSNQTTVILVLLFCSLDSLGYAFWREGEPTDSGLAMRAVRRRCVCDVLVFIFLKGGLRAEVSGGIEVVSV